MLEENNTEVEEKQETKQETFFDQDVKPDESQSRQQTDESGENNQDEKHWFTEVFPDLDEQTKKSHRMDRYDSFEKWLESQSELRKLASQKGIKPAEDAPKEDWDAFYETVNERPKNVLDYKLEYPDEAKLESFGVEKETFSPLIEALHEKGAAPGVVQTVLDSYFKAAQDAMDQLQLKQQEFVDISKERFQTEWGEDYAREYDLTKSFVLSDIESHDRKYGGDTLNDLKESGIINHPWFIAKMNELQSLKGGTDRVRTTEQTSNMEAQKQRLKKRQSEISNTLSSEYKDISNQIKKIDDALYGPDMLD